jgi:hypothetical protein
MEVLGIKCELPLEMLATHEDDGSIEVEPENWNACRLFVAMDTQWKMLPVQVKRGTALLRTGLDYSGLAAVAAGLQIALEPDLMAGLKLLEAEATGHFEARFKRLSAGA